MADIEMVVVDGVRYRPEDAPKKKDAKASENTESKQRTPANKARAADNK